MDQPPKIDPSLAGLGLLGYVLAHFLYSLHRVRNTLEQERSDTSPKAAESAVLKRVDHLTETVEDLGQRVASVEGQLAVLRERP